MSKHTPGPWDAMGCESDGSFGGREYQKCQIRAVSRTGILVQVSSAYGCGDGECAANARLVAAAPDLLAACEAAHKYLHNHPRTDPGALVAILAAAIAKAKGES